MPDEGGRRQEAGAGAGGRRQEAGAGAGAGADQLDMKKAPRK
ncbi:MAG TPA: hypothetical protein VJU84_21090 [Pyrinomonadaceae bacterium]|nr:hypothetical protein [Pyrinomonadaceae bacterium]